MEMLDQPIMQVYRVVIVRPTTREILCEGSGNGWDLLREEIPLGKRVARALTDALREHWGIWTIQLAVLTENEGFPCAIHELVGECTPPQNIAYLPSSILSQCLLTERQRRSAMEIIAGKETSLGRFAKIGWLSELQAALGKTQMESIEQWNCSQNFSLLSFTLDSRRYWFKAVGENKVREYAVTKLLADRQPEFVPAIVCDFPQWHAWVSESAHGKRVIECAAWEEIEVTFAGLAEFQHKSISILDELRNAGAVDWTGITILSLLDDFLVEAKSAMRAQTSFRVSPLDERQLEELCQEAASTMELFSDLGVPDTLIHGDMGHGNLVVRPDGPVFLDWAEAYIGNPFLSAEHLLADLGRHHCIDKWSNRKIWESFAAKWGITSDVMVDHHLLREKSAGLAAFVYAMYAWSNWRDRERPEFGRHLLRSMLRRSAREFGMTVEG